MSDAVERLLRYVGAIRGGHFELDPRTHSPIFLDQLSFLANPAHTSRLCRFIARRFRDAAVDAVLGPSDGGLIVAYETVRQLRVNVMWGQIVRRRLAPSPEFSQARGGRVLIVDDILTTGSTVLSLIDLLRELDAQLAGVAVIIDRAQAPMDFGAPFYACHELRFPTYPPDACPFCHEGMPLVRVPPFTHV